MPSSLSNSLCDLLDPMTLLASPISIRKLKQENLVISLMEMVNSRWNIVCDKHT